MENNEKRFEEYFAGRMSAEDVRQFNIALDKDARLHEDYQYFLSIKKSASLSMRDKFRAELNDVSLTSVASAKIESKKISSSNRKLGLWMIIILATFLLAYFSFQFYSSDKLEYIYAANFEIYEAQSSRGGSMEKLTALYNEGNYEEFIKRIDATMGGPEITMMLANANMKIGEYKTAEELLLTIPEESILRDLKYWNLGLVSLKQNHAPEATNHFRHLLAISNYKKSQVKKILLKLTK